MTATLAGADIRGYYRALGVQIPEWATGNASVCCFASPDRHQHEDRAPSASVDLISGAFLCHGCGAHGGAYDAAVAVGHTPRSAIDLMIAHGLTERRCRLFTAREVANQSPIYTPGREAPPAAPLQSTDADVRRWRRALAQRPSVIRRLLRDRGWSADTIGELELGLDRGRITIPIRDPAQQLIGVLRYQTHDTGRPKMLAVPGTSLGLVPHPAIQETPDVLLVEGPPDMIAARSHGLPAIAVPGDHAWRDDWARLFIGRHVTIVMDADTAGRDAAQRIHEALVPVTDARIWDLAPDRDDGYDLTDWLADHPDDAERLIDYAFRGV
jgi:hypothetical protein